MSANVVSQRTLIDRARQLAATTVDVEAVLEKLALRGQSAQARRLALCEQTNPRRAQALRRLAAMFGSLAPARRAPSGAP